VEPSELGPRRNFIWLRLCCALLLRVLWFLKTHLTPGHGDIEKHRANSIGQLPVDQRWASTDLRSQI
jgi:hypothetical protein